MPRLFIGIPIPPFLHRSITQQFFPTLKKYASFLSIVPPSKWHVTIHFIGDVSPATFEKIKTEFRGATFSAAFPLTIGGSLPIQTWGNKVVYLRVQDKLGFLNDIFRNATPFFRFLTPKIFIRTSRSRAIGKACRCEKYRGESTKNHGFAPSPPPNWFCLNPSQKGGKPSISGVKPSVFYPASIFRGQITEAVKTLIGLCD